MRKELPQRPLRLGLCAAWAILGGSACVSGEGEQTTAVRADSASAPRVVVGFIENDALNPWHDVFYAGSRLYPDSGPSAVTPEVLAEFGIGPAQILDRDDPALAAFCAEPGQAYWFRGTNLIGLSFGLGADDCLVATPETPLQVDSSASAAAILRENSEAIVFFVQGNSGDASGTTPFLLSHPAVDIAASSDSGANIGAQSVRAAPPFAYPGVYDGVVRQGKLHFVQAGEGLPRVSLRANAGPWWSMAVGSFSSGSGGTLPTQALPVDFAANAVQTEVPDCNRCRDAVRTDTDAHPAAAAGAASRALLAARRAVGHGGPIRFAEDGRPLTVAGGGFAIDNFAFRRALEQAARIPDVTDFDAMRVPLVDGRHVQPVVGPAAYTQVGWGVLQSEGDSRLIEGVLGALGIAGMPPAAKPQGFCAYQTEFLAERRAVWNTLTQLDPEHQPVAEDPFVGCDVTADDRGLAPSELPHPGR